MRTCCTCRRSLPADESRCPHCGTASEPVAAGSGPVVATDTGSRSGWLIGRAVAAVLTGRWSILRPGASQEAVAVQIAAGLAGMLGAGLGLAITTAVRFALGEGWGGAALEEGLLFGGGALGIGLVEWLWLTGRMKVKVAAPPPRLPVREAVPVSAARDSTSGHAPRRLAPVRLPGGWKAEPLPEGKVRLYEPDWKPGKAWGLLGFIAGPWIVMPLAVSVWPPGWSQAWLLVPLVWGFCSVPAILVLVLYLVGYQRAEFIVGRAFLEERRWGWLGIRRRRRAGTLLVIRKNFRKGRRPGELVHWYELALEDPNQVSRERPLLRAEPAVKGQQRELHMVARFLAQQTGWPLHAATGKRSVTA